MATHGDSNPHPKPHPTQGRGPARGSDVSAAEVHLWALYVAQAPAAEPGLSEPRDPLELAAFIDRTLPASEREAMEAHLASCPEDLRSVIEALRSIGEPAARGVELPGHATRDRASEHRALSFARALAARSHARRRSLAPADWLGLAAAVAAMIAISLLGYLAGTRSPARAPIEVEPQVERLAGDLSVGPLAEDAAPDLDAELMAILVGEGS